MIWVLLPVSFFFWIFYACVQMGCYFVTTGWILEIGLCVNSINQSINPRILDNKPNQSGIYVTYPRGRERGDTVSIFFLFCFWTNQVPMLIWKFWNFDFLLARGKLHAPHKILSSVDKQRAARVRVCCRAVYGCTSTAENDEQQK